MQNKKDSVKPPYFRSYSQPQSGQSQQPASKPSAPRPSASPYARNNAKPSLVWQLSKVLSAVFSHRGTFFFGVIVALVCYLANWWFHFSWIARVTGFSPWQSIGLSWLLSTGTTLFAVMPIVMRRRRRNVLHQIFLAGSKPQELPELNPRIVGNADELLETYRNSDRESMGFFTTLRWFSLLLESAIGFIFLGSIGTGVRALVVLVLFFASIFGCEWGVNLAIVSSEWELPPAIRKQLDELIDNAGKGLNLKRVSNS